MKNTKERNRGQDTSESALPQKTTQLHARSVAKEERHEGFAISTNIRTIFGPRDYTACFLFPAGSLGCNTELRHTARSLVRRKARSLVRHAHVRTALTTPVGSHKGSLSLYPSSCSRLPLSSDLHAEHGEAPAEGAVWPGVASRDRPGHLHSVSWHGTSWHGTSWHGTSWHRVSWHGTSWHSMAWYGTSWHGTSWHSDGD